ncbi:hypothetical protein GCG54_00011631 [Colletotrichum gloeosporioides]|uniref:Uncharacterized protein n=1 Tax=Colletotrichum gloeosporioides TaxID=474922 RepID=A0A8H4CTB2_COLGL|nr:uncharacterized protein GCG54_00011631 [Colletotrichum gloeosporioides]KAF3809431.1 hypothetical protein GCG54_00011631 [Colletotrichum gloeosporioides]
MTRRSIDGMDTPAVVSTNLFPVELEACQVTFVALNLDLSNRGPKLELQPVCGLTSCVFPSPTLAPQS